MEHVYEKKMLPGVFWGSMMPMVFPKNSRCSHLVAHLKSHPGNEKTLSKDNRTVVKRDYGLFGFRRFDRSGWNWPRGVKP